MTIAPLLCPKHSTESVLSAAVSGASGSVMLTVMVSVQPLLSVTMTL
jgi:hypothetical protein